MLWRSILACDYLTGPQTTLTVITIPVSTRPRNCSTISVGQIIRATSKTHPWSGWSSDVWSQPSHWAHWTSALGRSRLGLKNPSWLWWDLNRRPSNPQSNAQTTMLHWPILLTFTILYPPFPVMKHFAMQGNIVFMKFVIKTESPTSLLLSFDFLQRVLFCCLFLYFKLLM